MAIDYKNIPQALRVPGAYNEIDNSLAGSGVEIKRILLVGQKSSTGTATAGDVVEVFSASDAKAKFGAGSMLANMAQRFKNLNTAQQLYALALDDSGSGVAAAGKIVVSGTATKSGRLSIKINGVTVAVAVDSGDAAVAIATKLDSALANFTDLPISSAINASVDTQVDITAINKGEVGNDISILLGDEVSGVTLTITAMASGAGNPVIDYAALGDTHYHYFVFPYQDTASLTGLANELDSRYLPTRQIGARAFIAKTGTFAEIKAFTANLNSPHITCLGVGGSQQSAIDWATTNCALIAPRLSNDPAAPLKEIQLTGLLAPKPFTFDQRNQLLFSGVATWILGADGQAYLERQVTTYTSTANGDADSSYLDIQVPETLDAMRSYRNAEIAKKYKDYKIARNGTFGVGAKVMTPDIFRGFLLATYRDYFMTTRAWVSDYDAYKATLIVEINALDKNRIDYQDQPTLVGQFQVAAGLTQFK